MREEGPLDEVPEGRVPLLLQADADVDGLSHGQAEACGQDVSCSCCSEAVGTGRQHPPSGASGERLLQAAFGASARGESLVAGGALSSS